MSDLQDRYPEHQKLIAVKDESQTVGEFIEWLGEQGIYLCSIPPYYQSTYVPVSEGIVNMLARFFEIDLDKIEQEKRAILEELRAMNS